MSRQSAACSCTVLSLATLHLYPFNFQSPLTAVPSASTAASIAAASTAAFTTSAFTASACRPAPRPAGAPSCRRSGGAHNVLRRDQRSGGAHDVFQRDDKAALETPMLTDAAASHSGPPSDWPAPRCIRPCQTRRPQYILHQ